jgi:CRISPR-associated protein Cmr2
MTQHLFLFTIGPVQSFIAQARKTQDLYAGSKLLSDLIAFAINKAEEDYNAVITFPTKNLISKPNRFLASIKNNADLDMSIVGKEIEDRVRKKFKRIADETVTRTLNNNNNKPQNFDNQIDTFLDIQWVALKFNDNNYAEKYEEIERLLGAIKNVRTFEQINDGKGEVGRKCALCGERNIKIYRKSERDKKNERKYGTKWLYLRKLFMDSKEVIALEPGDTIAGRDNKTIFEPQEGEGLCAVCFTKRFYEKEKFPSTAAIATMDWLENIPDNEKLHYKNLFNNFDEQMYFEENHRAEYLKKYRHFKDTDSLKEAKNELKVFYQNYGKPSKYYALVMLDGDDMGRWISGEFLENGQDLEKFHELLSEELGRYAQTMQDRAKEPEGKLVYAGGDDVMAFVNLKYIFKVLEELRIQFPKFENMGFDIKDNHKSSASAGIVIAHYKTPLSEVLKWSRRMEKEAKEKGGRDAFAIAVLKHAGEINKTVWKWEREEEKNLNSRNIKLLQELIKELQDDTNGFSYSFIKNLDMEFQKLGEIKNDKMLSVELRRLLIRSSQIKGDIDLRKKKVEEWQGKLLDSYIDSQTETNFFSFLTIADFLARRTK